MNDLFIRIVRIVLHISSIRIICYTVFFGYDPSEHGCPRYRVFVPFDRQGTIVTHSRPRIFTIFQHLSDGTVGRKGVLHHFTNRTIFGGVGVLVLVALLLGPMPHVYEVVRRGACHSEAAGNNAENTDEGAESAAAVSLQREELAEAHLDAFASTHRLSPREREILGLISKGRDVPYIEQELVLSKSTVKTHIRHIYEKCEVSSRQALIDLLQSHPGD